MPVRFTQLGCATPPRNRLPWQLVWQAIGWGIIVIVTQVIVAHGCHRADVDHEPFVIPDVSDRTSR